MGMPRCYAVLILQALTLDGGHCAYLSELTIATLRLV